VASTRAAVRPFDPRRFEELRTARALVWGNPFSYQAQTGSTNDDALAAARSGAPTGSVFLADHQTAGRGRRGRTWLGSAGESLLFSILVRPEPGSAPSSALTLAAGLGVRAALQPYSRERLKVKWPNDVLAGPRKIAGVLCEGLLDGKRLEAVVIGVGINVGAQPFPPELQHSAVALSSLGPSSLPPGAAELALGQPLPERERLLLEVLSGIEDRVSTCLALGLGAMLSEFSEQDALEGTHVSVSGNPPLSGIARGVDPEGRLLVETDGIVIPVHSGTVRATGAQ
jgi:BirA family transcriptional regulator, biotin operon repressor / biotin---[acetyl-CoA-carboxylase] ligase